MKYGLPISILAHVIVGFSGAAFWVASPVYDVPEIVEIRLEGIELGKTTNLSEVVKPAPVIEEDAPPAEITEAPEEDEVEPVEQDAEPDVAPEETSEEALPDFDQAEDKPEPDVKPEDEPEDTPEPEEEKTETPNVRKGNSGETSLDDLFGDTEKLLNDIDTDPKKKKNQAANRKVLEDQQETGPRQGAGDRKGNQASVIDYLRAQIKEGDCWRSVSDLPDWERLDVTIRFRLDAYGNVISGPERIRPRFIPSNDKYMFAAEDRAIRAINTCAPFNMPSEKYDLWRDEDIELTFDEKF